jgi:hypothetical protein
MKIDHNKTSAELIEQLRTERPDVTVSVTWEHDPYCAWDGDGPDPEEDGLVAHDVCVSVRAIRRGELVEGTAYLGACFSPLGGPHCPEVDGYFPQLLEEALQELDEGLKEKSTEG